MAKLHMDEGNKERDNKMEQSLSQVIIRKLFQKKCVIKDINNSEMVLKF